MRKISTPDILPSLLYENPGLTDVELDEALAEEWKELQAIQKALDTDVLIAPSDTSVSIVMAYALSKKEATPSVG